MRAKKAGKLEGIAVPMELGTRYFCAGVPLPLESCRRQSGIADPLEAPTLDGEHPCDQFLRVGSCSELPRFASLCPRPAAARKKQQPNGGATSCSTSR